MRQRLSNGTWALALCAVWILFWVGCYELALHYGFNDQITPRYGFTSGVGPMILAFFLSLGVFFTAAHAYRSWTCQHSVWCYRHADHDLTDPDTGETHKYCHRHHPGTRSHRWSWEERLDIHRRSQEAAK